MEKKQKELQLGWVQAVSGVRLRLLQAAGGGSHMTGNTRIQVV